MNCQICDSQCRYNYCSITCRDIGLIIKNRVCRQRQKFHLLMGTKLTGEYKMNTHCETCEKEIDIPKVNKLFCDSCRQKRIIKQQKQSSRTRTALAKKELKTIKQSGKSNKDKVNEKWLHRNYEGF